MSLDFLSGAICVGTVLLFVSLLVDRAILRLRNGLMLLVLGALLATLWLRPTSERVILVGVPAGSPVHNDVRTIVNVDLPAPSARVVSLPAGVRPISEAELGQLMVELHSTPFPWQQLSILKRQAPRWLFTGQQAARVLTAFDFERLGALEVLRPQLIPGGETAVLRQLDGPFGEAEAARLVLGLP